MHIRTKIRAGGISINHNATRASGVKVKTKVRAGGINLNHNATLIRR